MRKIKSTILLFILFTFLVSSCSPSYIFDNKILISKGLTKEDFKNNDVDYDKIYVLENVSTKNNCKIEVIVSEISGTITDEIYYYAFKDNKLIFWGYPYQFANNEHLLLNDIANELYPIVKEEYDLEMDKFEY